MKVLRHNDKNFAGKLRELAAQSSLFDSEIENAAREIIETVRERGDATLLELTQRFDGAKLRAEQLAVTQAELLAASVKADESLRAAVAEAEKISPHSQKNLCEKIGACGIRTAPQSAKSLIRSSASAFTFLAAKRRSFRRP